MQNQSSYLDNLMSTYLETLRKDITSNEGEQDKLLLEIAEIKQLIGHLESLSEYPEWPNSFMQVNSLAFIPATIFHTGEHYVKLGPETYTLMSLKETLGFLQRKIYRIQKTLDNYKIQHQQLEERCKFSTESMIDEASNTKNMPHEIFGGKGAAHKTTSGFYEIIEPYVEEDEHAFYEKRQQHSSKKCREEKITNQEVDFYFERLNELQKQEDFRKELIDGVEIGVVLKNDNDSAVVERVKSILRKCGIYKCLLKDEIIQKYCYENTKATAAEISTSISNKSALNKLIIETLTNDSLVDPVDSLRSDFSNFMARSEQKDDQNTSSNDLAALAFLDSIESNMQV